MFADLANMECDLLLHKLENDLMVLPDLEKQALTDPEQEQLPKQHCLILLLGHNDQGYHMADAHVIES